MKRAGLTLIEVLIMISLLAFVLVLSGPLLKATISEAPRTVVAVGSAATAGVVTEQMRRHLDAAEGLPESVGQTHADERTLLVSMPYGTVSYDWDDERIVRRRLDDKGHELSDMAKTWELDSARMRWGVLTDNDRRYAVHVRIWSLMGADDDSQRKLQNSRVLFVGAAPWRLEER